MDTLVMALVICGVITLAAIGIVIAALISYIQDL